MLWVAVVVQGFLTIGMLPTGVAPLFVTIFVVWALIAWAVTKGWRLGRVAHLIFSAYLVVTYIWSLSLVHWILSGYQVVDLALDSIRYGCNTLAAVLLWTPPASRWFNVHRTNVAAL